MRKADPSLPRDDPPARPLEEWVEETLGPLALTFGPAVGEHPEDSAQH